MARPSPYPPELRNRAVRLVAEVRPDYPTEWSAMKAVAATLGIGSAETVRSWVRKAEVDAGARPGTTTQESAELKRLRRENAGLKRSNEILKAAAGGTPGGPLHGRAAHEGVRPAGVRRGKKIRTTVAGHGHERADDLIQRDFTADQPNTTHKPDPGLVHHSNVGSQYTSFRRGTSSHTVEPLRNSGRLTRDLLRSGYSPSS